MKNYNIIPDCHGTGWLPSMPDLRDYSEEHPEVRDILLLRDRGGEGERGRLGESKTQDASSMTDKVDLREWCSPVEEQGNIGSCTAHAAASLIEYYERRAFNRHIEASRLFLYKTTRNLMQTTSDSGSWIRTTMAALALCGIPDEKYWPYEVSKFDDEPPAFVYSIADNYQAVRYFRHDLSGLGHEAWGMRQKKSRTPQPASRTPNEVLSSVKKYLQSGIPSMFGFWGFGSFEKSDVPGGIPYPTEKEAARWGHAVAAVGYDDNKKIKNLVNKKSTTGALLIKNSWGKEWGENGYGWLPYDYVQNGGDRAVWNLKFQGFRVFKISNFKFQGFRVSGISFLVPELMNYGGN